MILENDNWLDMIMDNDHCLGTMKLTIIFNVECKREASSTDETFSRLTHLYGQRRLSSQVFVDRKFLLYFKHFI
jgi:hypothetical protein